MDDKVESVVEVSENGGEILSEEVTNQTTTIVQVDLSPVIGHLENLERVQINFFNDVIDILVFSLAVIIGLFAFKEFMDRSTRW